ncbi:molybdenum cofactor guanylyltransferase MobA [Alphaproteobacteria bacterium KMM 3653]|uniref:Molybdenum cofactor guanylyltransferase n=1 Tax=Harenicola maris TaxID=2841044 RepID=A0AAP2G4K9_9RHOB|nr:molybdenum cofactor guanylyltransferase MobA [Harenicola maris]
MNDPVGVILAGGLATRMGGGDKGLVSLGDQTVLEHVTARFAPQVGQMALNANGDAARFAGLGLPVLADTLPGNPGPLAGVLAGMEWGRAQGARHVITVAADTPFFPRDYVAKMTAGLEASGEAIATAATQGPGRLWWHPTFAIWPTSLADALRQAIMDGTRRVVIWAGEHGNVPVIFPDGPPDPFFNINTPEDLTEAERLLAGGAGA